MKEHSEKQNWRLLEEIINSSTCVDLSPTLEKGIPKCPPHPTLIIDPSITHEHDGFYCQTLVLGEHTGAHVDAPAHMIPEMMNETIDTFPAHILLAPALKYDLFKLGMGPGEAVAREQILKLEEEMGDSVGEDEIAVLHFGHQKYWTTGRDSQYYAENEPGLSEDAVKLFAERRVKAVACDTIACDTPIIQGREISAYGHRKYWLPNRILIIEVLQNLDKLPDRFYFMALPLKIKNGSGSPIRPIGIF